MKIEVFQMGKGLRIGGLREGREDKEITKRVKYVATINVIIMDCQSVLIKIHLKSCTHHWCKCKLVSNCRKEFDYSSKYVTR